MTTRSPGFPPTRMSMIQRACCDDEVVRRAAWDELAQAYWWPLYCFLRKRGADHDTSEEGVQDFFLALLEKDTLAGYDMEAGKFRTFILTCLTRLQGHRERSDRTQKRGGGWRRVTIDDAAERSFQELVSVEPTPEAAFDRAWALAHIERALDTLERRLRERGDEIAATVLRSYVRARDVRRPSYGHLSASTGLTENDVRHLLHRLREELKATLLEQVRAETTSEERAQEELKWLMQSLARR